MRILLTTQREAIARLAARDRARHADVIRQAARIVGDVKRRGDAALRDWTHRLDGRAPRSLWISDRELRAGWDATPSDVRRAIRLAIRHVRMVAARQVPRGFVARPAGGVRIEQRVQPLARVGCYVPGGRYPLPSTLVMTVVPAVAAGVPDVIVACPRPAPAVLCAAVEAGATRVLRVGGAQAIAALAYGTASVPRVDKIVGPGNAWVAAAKALVSADCAIDFQAGPSEIVVYSDRGRPEWIASDLAAQAEHDPAARAIFITTRRSLAHAVRTALARLVPRTGPARLALARNGAIVIARTTREAVDLVNRLAPEHYVCDTEAVAAACMTAGTIFIGPWSAQAAGDYTTGSNHVLPTGSAGRFRGGLTSADFTRVFTVQTLTPRGLRAIAPAAIALAGAEGLTAHAASIALRIQR